jgi:hypothetical protein
VIGPRFDSHLLVAVGGTMNDIESRLSSSCCETTNLASTCSNMRWYGMRSTTAY